MIGKKKKRSDNKDDRKEKKKGDIQEGIEAKKRKVKEKVS